MMKTAHFAFSASITTYEHEPYSLRNTLKVNGKYAAVMDQIKKLCKEPSIIVCNIGSWTIDVVRLDNGYQSAEFVHSLELGIIRYVFKISEQIRRITGLSAASAQIESLLPLA